MIEVGTVEASRVDGELRDFARRAGRALGDEVVLTGRVLAVSLGRSQQPYGYGVAARRAGEAAVARDVGRVFVSAPGFYQQLKASEPAAAAGFWRAWCEKDWVELERVVRSSRAGSGLEVLSVPSGAVHGRRRGARGRVQGKRASALVTDTAALRGYTRMVQGRVGMTKDGWNDAAEACGGTRGIPVWAGGRHAGKHGGAVVSRDELAPGVEIYNDVPWAREGLPLGVEVAAVGMAEERLLRRMEVILGMV